MVPYDLKEDIVLKFKPLKRYPRRYVVTDAGVVCSTFTGMPVRVYEECNRLYVYLTVNGKKVKKSLAHAVAEVYVQNPHDYKYIEYLDGNYKNCHPHNLVWVSSPQRSRASRLHKQEHELSKSDISFIKQGYTNGLSIAKLADMFETSRTTINIILERGKR